jgi:hypothetical protein
MASEHPGGLSEHACSTGSGQQLMCYCPDPRALLETALRHRRSFQEAAPFPHLAIDGLFPENVLLGILNELPSRDADQWTRWGSGSRVQESDDSAKMGISGEARWGPVTRNSMRYLGGMRTVRVEIPAELVVAAGLDAGNLAVEATRLLALELYREDKVSLGRAAELCHTPVEQFMEFRGRPQCSASLWRQRTGGGSPNVRGIGRDGPMN